jgi:hypothetical protein
MTLSWKPFRGIVIPPTLCSPFTPAQLSPLHYSGETNISRSYLHRYIHTLLSGSYADEKSEVASLLEHQFKVLPIYSAQREKLHIYPYPLMTLQLVTELSPKESHLSSALKASNLTKNRNLDCVCTDSFRVILTPKPGQEGSDYINASFLPGNQPLHNAYTTSSPCLTNTLPPPIPALTYK